MCVAFLKSSGCVGVRHLAQVWLCCLGGLLLMPTLRSCALLSVHPSGSFLQCLSENSGHSPRPTGTPTSRAFYSGSSVSLRVSHWKCPLLRYSVSPSFLSPRPPSARVPFLGCSRPSLPPKGYLQSKQRSSWFPLTRLLGSSKHKQWLKSNHAHTLTLMFIHLHQFNLIQSHCASGGHSYKSLLRRRSPLSR